MKSRAQTWKYRRVGNCSNVHSYIFFARSSVLKQKQREELTLSVRHVDNDDDDGTVTAAVATVTTVDDDDDNDDDDGAERSHFSLSTLAANIFNSYNINNCHHYLTIIIIVIIIIIISSSSHIISTSNMQLFPFIILNLHD